MIQKDNFVSKDSKIFVSGHRGMVGRACLRNLKKKGYKNLIKISSKNLDLRNQTKVENFFKKNKPQIVIHAAAKVGGIHANDTLPYDFLLYNMQIQNNLLTNSLKFGVKKFIFLGSSCIYPKFSKQPIKEKYLLSGSLEETNIWYAIAKISGLKLMQSINKQFNKKFVALMPTNLYGPFDNFDKKSSHVIPALIRKFNEAILKKSNSVEVWGTGKPKREFLHVDDLASAVMYAMENELIEDIYNIGTGLDISIKELVEKIKFITGYEGEVIWNSSMPDGTPRKLLDISKIKSVGWESKIDLKEGLIKTNNWFKKKLNYE